MIWRWARDVILAQMERAPMAKGQSLWVMGDNVSISPSPHSFSLPRGSARRILFCGVNVCMKKGLIRPYLSPTHPIYQAYTRQKPNIPPTIRYSPVRPYDQRSSFEPWTNHLLVKTTQQYLRTATFDSDGFLRGRTVLRVTCWLILDVVLCRP